MGWTLLERSLQGAGSMVPPDRLWMWQGLLSWQRIGCPDVIRQNDTSIELGLRILQNQIYLLLKAKHNTPMLLAAQR